MGKKLSIITTSYNAESTIEKTIKSVLENKTDDIEYIVIDGGSKDETNNIIKKFGNMVDYYISEKDNGMYDALNKGIQVANGEYVMLLAADDVLLKGMLEKALVSIEQNTEVWCGSIIVSTHVGFFLEESDSDLSKLKIECSLRHPATIFKKIVFQKYGYYDINYKCAGDRELFLRFYLKGATFQIERIPIVLFQEGGMSSKNRLEYAMPEGIEITKRYGFYETYVDKRVNKSTKKEKIKMIIESEKGERIRRIFYSKPIYYIYCILKKRKYNKLSKKELLLFNIKY